MSLYTKRRGAWSGARTAPAMSQPTRQVFVKAMPCTFCSMTSLTRCEYGGCDLPLCHKHAIRKSGGNLCPRHKDARLQQFIGEPAPGAEPILGEPSPRFKAKGPAVPHF